MKNRFLKYITSEKLITGQDTILLGVSGGIDSMVMADLFFRAKIKFAIAHCNFKLRGDESVLDEKFVNDFCSTLGIPFLYKIIFNERIFQNPQVIHSNGCTGT